MTATRHERLKKMLEDRRREVGDNLDRLKMEKEPNETEQGLIRTWDDFLDRVEVALEELEAGKYGVCACGAEISENLLAALPFAQLCHSCSEVQKREKALAGRRAPRTLPLFSIAG